MDRLERFKRRQLQRQKIREHNLQIVSDEIPDEQLVEKYLNSEIDTKSIDNFDYVFNKQYKFECNIEVSESEVKELLLILKNHFDSNKFNSLLAECKKDVIKSITNSFNIGRSHNLKRKIGPIDEDKLYNRDSNYTNSERGIHDDQVEDNLIVTTEDKVKIRQAIGLLLKEFFVAVFDEILDIYRHGFKIDNLDFFESLKKRLKRVAKSLVTKWKEVYSAFSEEFISNFLYNLVTITVNTFIATGKRIICIIREGFWSLLRAIKLICFPPEGMTYAQAAHEASKLIASGLITVGGVVLEQGIDAWIKSTVVLEPFSDVITTVLIGSITGIIITFVVYAIDKIDFFKVNEKEEHQYILNKLECNLSNMFAESNILIEELEGW